MELPDILPPPIGYRKKIPLYYPKTEAEIKSDSYEIYNPNVIRSARNFYEGDYGSKLLEEVSKHLTDSTLDHIVELGCGSGFLIGKLAEKNPSVTCLGLDYSYQMLKMGAHVFKNETDPMITISAFQNGMKDFNIGTRNLPNLTYALSDACVTPLADASVDFCFSCFLFDRVADPEKLIKEQIRLLKPGGSMLIISPFNYLSQKGWTHWYPIKKVILKLQETGLTLKDHSEFTLDEPLDVRGNKVVWKVDSFLLTF